MTTISNKTHASSQAENMLAQSERSSRPLIKDGSDIIVLLNAGDIVIYMSPSITSLLGYTPIEVEGLHERALVHLDDLGP